MLVDLSVTVPFQNMAHIVKYSDSNVYVILRYDGTLPKLAHEITHIIADFFGDCHTLALDDYMVFHQMILSRFKDNENG